MSAASLCAPHERALPLRAACLSAAAILAGCAGQPDHFYALTTLPESTGSPTTAFTTHVMLTISLPPVIDRRQMVIATTTDQLLVLEHERWAAPLPELVAQTLARDIEQRRADVLVADRGFDQASLMPVKIRVDIVRMSVREGGQATLEAHWRVVDTRRNTDEVGGETLSSPVAGGDYAAVARAFSNDLSSLADRLTAKLPAP
ncbi:MAG: PqiC family protein [Steroidobacteraceae bacterium]|jgi:uncharacterized lipoprotein YmbA